MRDMIEQLEVAIVEDAINQDEVCMDSEQTLLSDALKELEHRRHQLETYTKPLPVTLEMHSFLKDFYRSVFTQHKKRFFLMERHNYPVVDEFFEALCNNSDPSGILSGQNISLSKEEFWQRYEFRCGSIERIVSELRSQRESDVSSTTDSQSAVPTSPGKPLSTASPLTASSQTHVQETREPAYDIPTPQTQDLESPSSAASRDSVGEDSAGVLQVDPLPTSSETREHPLPVQTETESWDSDTDNQIEEELYDALQHELKDSESCVSANELDPSSQCETEIFVSCSAETEVTSPSKTSSAVLRPSTKQPVYFPLDHEEFSSDIPVTADSVAVGGEVYNFTLVDSIAEMAKLNSPRVSEPTSVSEKEELDWNNAPDLQGDDELKDSESCVSANEQDSPSQFGTDIFVSCSAETEVTSPSKNSSTALRSSKDQPVYSAVDHEELSNDIPLTEPTSLSAKKELDWSNVPGIQDEVSDQVSSMTQNEETPKIDESFSPSGKTLEECNTAWDIREDEPTPTSNLEKNAKFYRDDDETPGDYSDDCKCQGCIIL